MTKQTVVMAGLAAIMNLGVEAVEFDIETDEYGAVIMGVPVRTKGMVEIPDIVQIQDGEESYEEVVDISSSALDGCKWVTEFTVQPENEFFCVIDGVLYDADVSTLIRCPPGKTGRVVVPETVFEVRESAFSECVGVTDVVLPPSLVKIGKRAFLGCERIGAITIPSEVKTMGGESFSGCVNLTNMVFKGNAPQVETEITCQVQATDSYGRALYWEIDVCYDGLGNKSNIVCQCLDDTGVPVMTSSVVTCESTYSESDGIFSDVDYDESDTYHFSTSRTSTWLTLHVPCGSRGWNRYDGAAATNENLVVPFYAATNLPVTWCGRSIVYSSQESGGTPSASPGVSSTDIAHVSLTVTNVVVNYVLNSVQPEVALPVTSEGLVNVITEIKSGGAVAVPQSWAANYPEFEAKFGTDFTKALMKETGKKDSAGNPLLVWQDYVTGTDPTDVNDGFKASVTMVDGNPVVSWTPELPEEQAALRVYTIYGKVKLQDADWTVVPQGSEANYNFFKVTVEMK